MTNTANTHPTKKTKSLAPSRSIRFVLLMACVALLLGLLGMKSPTQQRVKQALSKRLFYPNISR